MAKLTASDGEAGDYFGETVSISGNTAFVGASGNDDFGSAPLVRCYLFDNGSGWTQVAKIAASDSGENDCFGTDVAISGMTAIIGARSGAGSTYVFKARRLALDPSCEVDDLRRRGRRAFRWPWSHQRRQRLSSGRVTRISSAPTLGQHTSRSGHCV